MIIGKVVGRLWSTRKDEKLNGQKFLVVRLMKNGIEESEDVLVAADIVGAGKGDLVMITQGSSTRQIAGLKDVPIDSIVVGIIDSIEMENA